MPTTEAAIVARLGPPEARSSSPLDGGETVTLSWAGGALRLLVTQARVRMLQLEATEAALPFLQARGVAPGGLGLLGRPDAEVERALGRAPPGEVRTFRLTSGVLAPLSFAKATLHEGRCVRLEAMLLPRAGVGGAVSAAGGYRLGQSIEVEWKGTWWKAHVIAVEGERYRIHYDGWGAEWDEWVTAARMRQR